MASEHLTHHDYTVGWICALPKELIAAAAMLDETHPDLHRPANDHNAYTLGRIGGHNVVVACLPKGEMGNNGSATVAARMISTFPSIKFGLMVGIGGGVPKKVRLGDLVVGIPSDEFGGVVQWDFGKTQQGGTFKRIGALNRPPTELLTALTRLEKDHEMRGSKIPQYLEDLKKNWPKLAPKYTRSASLKDVLFRADYNHVERPDDGDAQREEEDNNNGDNEEEEEEEEGNRCINCDQTKIVRRKPRDMRVHYGLIASGNQVIKDAASRDKINKELGGNVLCFEMEAAGLMNDFPCLVIRGICDYADSHKNKDWQEHAAAVAAAFAKELLSVVPMHEVEQMPGIQTKLVTELKAVNQGLERAFEQRESYHRKEVARKLTKDQRRCHQAFKISTYEQQKNINPDRAKGTCEWVLQSPEYLRWWKATNNDLLWVSADPGCGKSVLAKSLIDDVFKASDPTISICYFFFKDNDEQNNLSTALCAVLHQLFGLQPQLIQHALPFWEKNREKIQHEVEDLWRIFMAATSDPSSANTICVFDALDECGRQDQKQLIKMLQKYYAQACPPSQSNWLKFLVTSRPYGEIEEYFQPVIESFPQIHLRGEEENDQIHYEISLVVKIRVAELGRKLKLKAEIRARLERELLHMEHRTYLWLYLAIDDIQRMFKDSFRPDQESIRLIPKTVDAAYEKILDRVNPEQEGTVRKILQIIVGARRPLTIHEMGMALGMATSQHVRRAEETGVNLDGLGEKIRQLCGLFVFIKDSRIYFIHQTAREFLIADHIHRTASFKWHFNNSDTEAEMARICVSYLLLDDLASNDGGENTPSLLEYSAQNWSDHFRDTSSPKPELVELVYQLYDLTTERFAVWFPIFWEAVMPYNQKPKMNAFHLAAFNGHDVIICCLVMNDKSSINRRDDWGRNALMWASLRGYYKSVQILLKSGADVNAQGGYYGNALQVASVKEHLDIVLQLLENGADVNAQGGYYGNSLQAASYRGYLDMILQLLEKGADVNAQGGKYGNALQAASYRGHLDVVLQLLEKGADVNAQGGDYGNALQAASVEGHLDIVLQLLEKGADVNSQGGKYGNALLAASVKGHLDMVLQLLEKGADVNAQGGNHGNALQAASDRGHLDIVLQLLEKGADVNAQSRYYGNALQAASSGGHLDIVLQLLENGADVNAQGGKYSNALHAASVEGHLDIVLQLLEKGADVNAQGGRYGNALQAASVKGHLDIVLQLLEKGADVNAQGGKYGNALQAASYRGHLDMVLQLLEKGADVNALHAASVRGHLDVVLQLLEKGADVNAQGGNYDNTLWAALHLQIVRILQENGANANF